MPGSTASGSGMVVGRSASGSGSIAMAEWLGTSMAESHSRAVSSAAWAGCPAASLRPLASHPWHQPRSTSCNPCPCASWASTTPVVSAPVQGRTKVPGASRSGGTLRHSTRMGRSAGGSSGRDGSRWARTSKTDCKPGSIKASVGQAATHWPQPMQASLSSTTARFTCSAWVGQACAQARHCPCLLRSGRQAPSSCMRARSARKAPRRGLSPSFVMAPARGWPWCSSPHCASPVPSRLITDFCC